MLYFVATPIGNLKEITLRAIEVLKSVDVIFAEDTRHSLVLFNAYEIAGKRLVSYQKFNEQSRCDEIVDLLHEGKSIAVVSDAGMPLISDPGGVLVQRLVKEGLDFSVVSGACACINALVLSGLDTSSFCMLGFLSEKLSKRTATVENVKKLPQTLVFYSAPHDVEKDLAFLHSILGGRKVSVVREISKMYETVHRGILGQQMDIVQKGEMVIVVEGASSTIDFDETLSIKDHVKQLTDNGMPKMDAMKTVAKQRNLKKNEVYKEMHE